MNRNAAAARRAAHAMILFGTASFVALATTSAHAAAAAPAAAQVPEEEVLVTGTLISGAPAVGVPITALGEEDFQESGSLTIADVLKTMPALEVTVAPLATDSGATVQRPQEVAIHGIQTGAGTETLMMVNGMRYPIQGFSAEYIDPSIVPQLAVQRVDVLAEGASATYGSDAVAGVVNVIMRRGFEGAISFARYAVSPEYGAPVYTLSQLYGTTWDTGQVTATYEWYHEDNVPATQREYFTLNFEPYGFDDRRPFGLSMPATVTVGASQTRPGMAALGFDRRIGARACANCFSIPQGVGWNYGDQAPGPTTNWTAILTNAGVNNLHDPAEYADISAAQDSNKAAITFDQIVATDIFGILRNVNLFVDGFYSNRRTTGFYLPGASPAREQALREVQPPRTNPYYPAGAPNGLRVSYNLAAERNSRLNTLALDQRYAFGFEADMPFDWQGKLYYAKNETKNFVHVTGMVNANMVDAALGNTVASVAASGTRPGQAAFTKPANVPFLNLFCDATLYRCNSPQTLAYIGAFRNYDQRLALTEVGYVADGPLFELPGGTLRAAIGANYYTQHYYRIDTSNFQSPNTAIIDVAEEPGKTSVYAFYGEVNVPIIGPDNMIPLVEALTLEAAYRYDHYYDFGGVNTPKVSARWTVGYGLTIRGAWGEAFRGPGFAEYSQYSAQIQPFNTAAGTAINEIFLNCAAVPGLSAGGVANPGSLNHYLNPTCSSAVPLQHPGGIEIAGGAGASAHLRTGPALGPEDARSYSVGFNFAPPDGFLAGLNIDASYFNIRIDDLISTNLPAGPQTLNTNDPANVVCTAPGVGCKFFVRANPNLPITDPANAVFLEMVQTTMANPRSNVDPRNLEGIQWINDQAVTNIGWREVSGLDFDTRYDFELANWGAFNVGMRGVYRIEDESQAAAGADVVSAYEGDTGGRFRWRARLGWAEGADGWSITGFVNHIPHGALNTGAPPACFWAAGFSAGSCYPGSPYWGPYDQYPLYHPGLYTVDLTIGFQTGDRPMNPFLQNINFQLTVNNLLDQEPPFDYNFGSGRGRAFREGTIAPHQRYFSFAVTKLW